ncbi:MAG: CopG family transcriptional regulator [Spirochaetales bacterium]|nr:CopG family transcriptional regulator [Spirochaetales bacterium]
MAKQKHDVVTFKVESSLAAILKKLPNKSAFIRNAILKSFENLCPLCQGSGILSIDQKEHWDRFKANHPLKKCSECESFYLECRAGRTG